MNISKEGLGLAIIELITMTNIQVLKIYISNKRFLNEVAKIIIALEEYT